MVAFNEKGQGYFTFEELQNELDKVEKEIEICLAAIKSNGEYFGLNTPSMTIEKYNSYLRVVTPLMEYRNKLFKKHQELIFNMGVFL